MTCKRCDKQIFGDKRNVYCSKECSRLSLVKIKICKICNKKYWSSRGGKLFCSSKCYGKHRTINFVSSGHPNWQGGILYHNGYRYKQNNNHPYATKKGYVMEHRLVMEKYLGRYLDPKKEIVHHKNENKMDNRIENLEAMSRSQHLLHHHFPSKLK